MGRYINWDDVMHRYPETSNIGGATEVGCAHIYYAEYELDGLLSRYYTTPFSTNNITAKDLAIDLAYLRLGNFKLSDDDRKQFREEIMMKIQKLIDGEAGMQLVDGTVVYTAGETIYSSTSDYHPVFGFSPEEYFEVDSSLVEDEEWDRS